MKRFRIGFIIFAALFFCSGLANSTTVLYNATDLADITPGVDLWQYSYLVNGFTFNKNYGFTVYFDESLYSGLANPTAPSGWDPIVLEPDPFLGPGAFDALALVNNAPLSSPFTVDFAWLGTGTPGAQIFEVYSLDASGLYSSIESGQTAPVPEPGTMVLLGSGLLGLIGLRRKRKK